MDYHYLERIKSSAKDPTRRYWDGCVRRVVKILKRIKLLGNNSKLVRIELLECEHIFICVGTCIGADDKQYRVCHECEEMVNENR